MFSYSFIVVCFVPFLTPPANLALFLLPPYKS
jgi:hypothetical protein